MMQIKNDMFAQDQENDNLADLKKYCDIYDKFDGEIDEKMQKYTQQETVIQKLQGSNTELLRQLEFMEFKMGEMGGSDSDETEMMHINQGDQMSDGMSNWSRSQQSKQPRSHRNFKSEITPLALVKELKPSDEAEESMSKSDGDDDEDKLPTMQDLAGASS